jgi:hypothetical protein
MSRAKKAELVVWGLVNVLIPLLIPTAIAYFWNFFYPMGSFELFELLLNNGTYTFFVLVVYIGLWQDYTVVPAAFNPFLYTLLFICLIFTFVIFGSFLGFIPKTTVQSMPLTVTLQFLFFALLFKLRIIKMKP